MKIAVYSCNLGNYRNELSVDILNNIKFNKDIDYYFFTDQDIKLSNWNVIKTNLEESLGFMNKYRNTSKYLKFVLPKILKSYDYVIWCDTKRQSLNNINSINIDKIKKLISETNKKIFLIQHPVRTNPNQEIDITKKLKLENEENADKFKEKIKDIVFNSKLPDTTTIIRKVNNEINNLFKEVYDNLLNEKLCRDQNIIQYIFYKFKSEKYLYYFSNQIDLRKKIQD